MRVDDDIGAHSVGGEWHIFFRDDISYSTFLSVARRELITDNWLARSADANLCNTISVTIAVNEILIYIRLLGCAMNLAMVFVFNELGMVVAIFLDGDNFCNNNIAIFNKCIFRNETFVVDLVVVAEFHTLGL